ncbi:MAG TPA: ATPase [Clostridiales bacterium]|nr:MAG: ATPase [Clostridiales bacterium GWD2_32_59]HAN09467.1 ATPase [Clostridiales bacterium]
MERRIEKMLEKWKNSSGRKPLILQGARQVGKTYTTLQFGKKYYKNVAYFNMENKNIASIFEIDLNPQRIIDNLSYITNQTITAGETLIFFDEIQNSERALTSLKYFNEMANEYHIIAAGSLLGVFVNREKYSFPVGKVDMQTMYPMNFEEFLMALGQDFLIKEIKVSYYKNTALPSIIHDKAMDFYKKYITIGGMPAVINEYMSNDDMNLVLTVQNNINTAYIADMAKHATPNTTTKIMAAYNSIPAQLAKDNRKFQYRIIKSGARAYEYETPIDWLRTSGIIEKCIKAAEGKGPLTAYADYNCFKVYITDIGLLCSKFGVPYNAILYNAKAFEDFKGPLTENYVAASLAIKGYSLYYWESNGIAEVDFLIQDDMGNIIPIEVKSSENVKSKSLNQYISKYKPPYAIRVSTKNFGFENNIKSVPLYAVFLI